MKLNRILTVLSAAAFGFFIGISFPIQITPKVFSWSIGEENSTFASSDIFVRFCKPVVGNRSSVERIPILHSNATSEKKIVVPEKPKGAERLPPNIVVRESDLHLRRLWGNPREDTSPRKYLLAMTIGYNEKTNVNATVHKFSNNFDVVLFHYDGRTSEWDGEFEWSKEAAHVSARGQTKWWFAKRFMHPSVVAPYEYIFLWDEDLGIETFDAEEYLKIVKKHGLEISQPGLDTTRGPKPFFDITIRRNDGSEIHKSTLRSPDAKCWRRPCSGFVEIMAPVFSREAWTCVWHMIQNDLVHGHALDWNFWRCVDEPDQHIGIVDAQYVAHHAVVTLGSKGKGNATVEGSRSSVLARQRTEFDAFNARMRNAERAQQAAARLALPIAATRS
ncbi:hypothetical protein PR202_ga20680 [Eleusine coracana subsp. coracana]|uniref:Uncharacterized protein n=1 Tax=Eleusine coracana subsp. coracana TaxID=191504 RepID=A0AAV5CYQ0_ELECO|nr:hypothetical protein QOZ80_8AG0626820 [Eleusine coracana subsp. coracana]GJN03256.1 hypothetical protein PR202_ga20680 [Eleusine coracana subsp. coracana]